MTEQRALLILNAASIQLSECGYVHDGTNALAWSIPTDTLIKLACKPTTPRKVKVLIRSLYDTRMAYARAEMIAS